MPPPRKPVSDVWPLGRIKPGTNCRVVTVDDSIRELHRSILEKGLLNPLCVIDRPDDNLLSGNRRFAAMCLGGIDSARVSVYPPDITPNERLVINLVENIHREDLTPAQLSDAYLALLDANPGWSNKELGACVNKDPSLLVRYLAVRKCAAEVADAYRAGRIGLRAMYETSQLPPEAQPAALANLLGGATVESVARRRQKRQPDESQSAPADRSARLRIPISADTPEGFVGGVVTVSGAPGEEVGFDEIESLLREATKALLSARRRNMSLKTFARAMKDAAEAE